MAEEKETRGMRWADCEDDEGKEEEEREEEQEEAESVLSTCCFVCTLIEQSCVLDVVHCTTFHRHWLIRRARFVP